MLSFEKNRSLISVVFFFLFFFPQILSQVSLLLFLGFVTLFFPHPKSLWAALNTSRRHHLLLFLFKQKILVGAACLGSGSAKTQGVQCGMLPWSGNEAPESSELAVLVMAAAWAGYGHVLLLCIFAALNTGVGSFVKWIKSMAVEVCVTVKVMQWRRYLLMLSYNRNV